ncbi:class I mannose-6-phosphate isomerase [Bacteriovoracaceae bacterium]|nr:class I mannose-6-phosphate isomerase [Bacteriovoracaceae bacterium]
MQINELKPYLEMKPWGGQYLATQKRIKINSNQENQLGETWEVSAYPNKESQLLGSENFPQIDYLVKFIDTSDFLSVQVHPHEEYAHKYENDHGKDECWLILKSKPDSCLYLGLKKNCGKEEFYQAVKENKSILKYLNKVKVKAGDFFIIPTGLVHAIGPGITLVETQTSSGVTYRIWDWGRVDSKGNSRELHIEKAIDVINFEHNFNKKYSSAQLKNIFRDYHSALLIDDYGFRKSFVSLNKNQKISLDLKPGNSIVVLKGKMKCKGKKLLAFKSYFIGDKSQYNLQAEEKSQFLIIGSSE